MKQIVLTVFAMLFVSLVASQAQTDTTNAAVASEQAKQINISSAPDAEAKEDRVEVSIDEIPEAVRESLKKGTQYKGWEEAKAYVDKSTSMYLVHITEGTSTRTYRFDKDGKLVSENPSGDK